MAPWLERLDPKWIQPIQKWCGSKGSRLKTSLCPSPRLVIKSREAGRADRKVDF